MNLLINVDATDKTQSAVVSSAVTDRDTPVAELQLLVFGNLEPLVLSFCDAAGAVPAFVTDATTSLSVGLGLLDLDGLQAYTSTAVFSIVGNTRVGLLSLNTTALRTALHNALAAGGRAARCGRGAFVLEIRKTTAAGVVQSLGLLRVYLAERILPADAVEDTDSYAATKVITGTDIDWSLANTFSKTLAANTTFAFLNPPDGHTIVAAITNTAGNFTVTWPAVAWSGGTPPVQTPGVHTDIYTFTKIGAVIYGAVVQNF